MVRNSAQLNQKITPGEINQTAIFVQQRFATARHDEFFDIGVANF
jgi:hypothetical protein